MAALNYDIYPAGPALPRQCRSLNGLLAFYLQAPRMGCIPALSPRVMAYGFSRSRGRPHPRRSLGPCLDISGKGKRRRARQGCSIYGAFHLQGKRPTL